MYLYLALRHPMILPGRGAGWVCRMFSGQKRRGSVDVNLGKDIGYGKKHFLWGIIRKEGKFSNGIC
jgi:hypothetical protein